MNGYQHWLTPDVTRAAAMTILHFLWQGAALAALAFAGMALARRAAARYAIAVGVLALMVATPVVTFVVLQQRDSRQTFAARGRTPRRSGSTVAAVEIAPASDAPARGNSAPTEYFSWLVYAWLAGVVLLSLRPATGFVALQRLRRKQAMPVSELVRARCLSLQETLGIRRVIRYCECLQLDAPAAVGWFRPAIYLPMSAISGLSMDQLDAVIAHELMHVRRLDAFVNLFQIAVETLLFYHPAVWWLSKRIRAERENCCDDVAIAVCGNAAEYARALANMAEWQAVPALAMAANRGPLATRVARILGVAKSQADLRGASLAASVLCLTVSLAAGHALFGAGQTPKAAPVQAATIANATAATSPQIARAAVIVITPEVNATAPAAAVLAASGAEPTAEVWAPEAAAQDSGAAEKAPAANAGKSSYIDGLKSAGLDNLSIDQLVALKIQGVTPDYVRGIRAAGLQPDADEIVGLKIQGITPEYIKEIRDLGLKADIDNVMAMKIQGVTSAYVRELRTAYPQISSDDIVAMKIQGITPEYIRGMHEITGLKLDADEIIGMKIQGVSPEYIRDMKALGIKFDADELIGMKIQGVTPEYVKALQAAGLHFDTDELIGAKIRGITPEFIARARQHGFKELDLEKLIQLKIADVLD